MKLPYGLADFHRLITQGFTYVDRTAYIARMEEFGDALLFVRPRRFGKSLWLSTLANWYDLRTADQHPRLFGGLAAAADPTGTAHRYFVLNWNFSGLGLRPARSDEPAERLRHLANELNRYVNHTVRTFASDYREHLPESVEIDDNALFTLGNLLAVLRRAGRPLCLLVDEYDNFANEIMLEDEAAYAGLVQADGPMKALMKRVKQATEGEGLERLVMTGVTPLVLSDLTSGLNIAQNVTLAPELNALAGFTEAEITELLERIRQERRGGGEPFEVEVDEALDMLRTWYNGYRFAPEAVEAVYNPTLTLYFLNHLRRRGTYPRQLLDTNLAADANKLEVISRAAAGKKVVVDLLRTSEPLQVEHIEDTFTLREMLSQVEESSALLASFLYYFGMLTLVGETAGRRLLLAPPNLVVRGLYLGKILHLLLPDNEDPAAARKLGWELARRGELEPLLAFIEERLFPSFGRRDYLHLNELTVKTTFMALLFDDVNYVMLSEPSVPAADSAPGASTSPRWGYADFVFLLRPDARESGLWDLVLEFKYIPLDKLGKNARQLDALGREERAPPACRGGLRGGGRAARAVPRRAHRAVRGFEAALVCRGGAGA